MITSGKQATGNIPHPLIDVREGPPMQWRHFGSCLDRNFCNRCYLRFLHDGSRRKEQLEALDWGGTVFLEAHNRGPERRSLGETSVCVRACAVRSLPLEFDEDSFHHLPKGPRNKR